MDLTALALNCSLKPAGSASSTDKLIEEVLAALATHGIASAGTIRIGERNILPGVTSDEGHGDDWPAVRQQILEADILVFGTPIWMGHPCSHAQRVLERLDAFLGETDANGRMISFDRVAIVAVVGNEDGAHHVARRYLNDGVLYGAVDERRRPLGAVLVNELDDYTTELRAVAVDEDEQGRGLGTWLVAEVCVRLRASGKRIVVGTASSGIRQLAFYQRLGFRLTHVERDFFMPQRGYPLGLQENDIPTRDMVWMELE